MDMIEKMLLSIQVDLAGVKTDVLWLKRSYMAVAVAICVLLGIDASGVMEV